MDTKLSSPTPTDSTDSTVCPDPQPVFKLSAPKRGLFARVSFVSGCGEVDAAVGRKAGKSNRDLGIFCGTCKSLFWIIVPGLRLSPWGTAGGELGIGGGLGEISP